MTAQMTAPMTAPVIVTDRLVLRPHRIADFEHYAAMLADAARARFMGGPHDRRTAWNWFCGDIAQWALFGHGSLAIDLAGPEPRYIGQVAVIQPPQFPEPELGWSLFDGFEGRGYMTEAAHALRRWVFATCGMNSLVSYIDPANTRSAAVAARLGAAIDPEAATPGGEPTTVWRHRRPA